MAMAVYEDADNQRFNDEFLMTTCQYYGFHNDAETGPLKQQYDPGLDCTYFDQATAYFDLNLLYATDAAAVLGASDFVHAASQPVHDEAPVHYMLSQARHNGTGYTDMREPTLSQSSSPSSTGTGTSTSSEETPRNGTARSKRAKMSARRAMEDQVLLEGKKKGLSYKEILHSHDFGIAESTLRGRYRSLTKNSAQRVRKPFWYDDDITLLLRAVPLHRRHSSKPKVFWESVGTYIHENGGSRKFSGKTCHVKYTQLTGKHW